ncbi:MAG: Nif3-like dinuclear metal center hexameric protein [Muribaculaceae bacterium]|nr:Nif3-like dinuclear metal center hexameric protein [Muribaculaceae bacterium]
MLINEITDAIEQYAPLRLQEEWDNAGIQVGNPEDDITGVLLCTDATEAVVAEAIERGCNLVIAHHPLIFHGLKKIMGRTPVERAVAMAIKHDITIYSAHTNMDSAWQGVSFRMADKIGMTNVQFLDGNQVAPYGEQDSTTAGCGVIGDIEPMTARDVLKRVKAAFEVGAVRYSGDGDRTVSRVALCGGAGGFLLDKAVELGAQLYVTADMRYHDFLDNSQRIVTADIGHYESEHFTKEIFLEIIQKKNPTFAVVFAKSETNQVNYL